MKNSLSLELKVGLFVLFLLVGMGLFMFEYIHPITNNNTTSTSVLRCSENGCSELDGTVCWNQVKNPFWTYSGAIFCEDEQGNEYALQSSCMCWIQEQ